MIEISTTGWATDEVWSIAPAGISWIVEGSHIQLGNDAQIGSGVQIGDAVRLGNSVQIDNDVRISHGVHLGNDAQIGNRVHLGNSVQIGNDAQIGNSVQIGNGVQIGNRVYLGNSVQIGNDVRLGDGAVVYAGIALHDLGYANEYRKTLSNVNGVAYIGAGCHWFTLADAIKYWSNHKQDRRATMCLMQSAISLATHYNLKQE